MQYTQLVNEKLEFRPRAVQEAIAFAYMQANRQMPQGTVSPVVLQNLQGFMQAYNQGAQSPALQNYSNTVWYYLLKK